MRIRLIAVGQKMPSWVVQGCQEYRKRLPAEFGFQLIEIPPVRRNRQSDLLRLKQEEADRLLSAIGHDDLVIALDEKGRSWSTVQLAQQLTDWQMSGRDIALLIGGPDGLDDRCLQRADRCWSLSALTLPHAMVRIVVIEQLYRAWSVNANHPYHRQ